LESPDGDDWEGHAAYFSVRGMVVLFPGAPTAIIAMAGAMEAAKLISVAWPARQWRSTSWPLRAVLITLVAGLAAINAAGVYSQLFAAHLGDRVAATASAESEAAALAARIDVQSVTVADLDARVAQIDAAVSEMTRRGRAANALDAIGAQRKAREALVTQRRHEAEVLSGLKAEPPLRQSERSRSRGHADPIRRCAIRWNGRPSDPPADPAHGADVRPAGDRPDRGCSLSSWSPRIEIGRGPAWSWGGASPGRAAACERRSPLCEMMVAGALSAS
jgi:hypothetical protein